MKNKVPFFKRNELVVLMVLLAVIWSLRILNQGQNKAGTKAVVYLAGIQTAVIDLMEDSILYYGAITVEISDGKIAVIASDCPDKLCIKNGIISTEGQIIACLPNDFVIKIIGTDIDIMGH